MVGKNIQIYGVQIREKDICKSKKLKVDLFTNPRQNSLSCPYNHPLGRHKLLIPPS